MVGEAPNYTVKVLKPFEIPTWIELSAKCPCYYF